MGTKRSTTKKTTRKPRVTAKMRQERTERLAQLGALFPIADAVREPVKRFLFLGIVGSGTQITIDSAFEDLDDARESFSCRGDWDFDPNPPPEMVIDLDCDELAITALSYNPSLGMELAHRFELDADRDYEYVPEAGGHWSDAYCCAPRVNPAYSPIERLGKLRDWLECEWRDSWEDDDE